MPFNDSTTLKAHLREGFINAIYDNLSGAEISLALTQSAGIVTNKTGTKAPEIITQSDPVLQLCDAWIFAWFATDRIEGLEEELLTLVDRKYREVMKLLKDWAVDNARKEEESTVKAESKRTNWFTDVSGVIE